MEHTCPQTWTSEYFSMFKKVFGSRAVKGFGVRLDLALILGELNCHAVAYSNARNTPPKKALSIRGRVPSHPLQFQLIMLKHDPISACLFLSQGPAADELCQGLILQRWAMQESRGLNARVIWTGQCIFGFCLSQLTPPINLCWFPASATFPGLLCKSGLEANNQRVTQKAGTGLGTIVLRPCISVLCLFTV